MEPLATVCVGFALGHRFSWQVLVTLLPICGGVAWWQKKKQWGIHSQQRLEHLLTATSEYVCLVRGRETTKSLNSFVRLQWHHPVGPRVLVHLECVLLCSRTWRFAATQMHRVPFPSGLAEMGDTMALSRFIYFARF